MSDPAPKPDHPADVIDQAVRQLLSVRHWGDTAYVTLPLIGPDGSGVTVRVTPAPGGFRVDDAGFAYQDLERLGAERSFARTAAALAETYDLELTRRSFRTTATAEELARAISDVGTASWTRSRTVHERLLAQDEAEIEATLRPRLEQIFGASRLDAAGTITGFSANPWTVSAIVHLERKIAVFQAVGEHANSVYRTSAAFHDLAALTPPPALVAVVKDKTLMGAPRLTLLAQAGRVIQGDQADDVYLRAAA